MLPSVWLTWCLIRNVAKKMTDMPMPTDQDISCVLDGSRESSQIRREVFHSPNMNVRRCHTCGLVFLWPCPKPEELTAYYTSEYRAQYLGVIDPEKKYREGLSQARDRTKRLLPYVDQNTRLLDVGASSGAFLSSVRDFAGEAIGVEPDEAHREWGCRVKSLTILPSLEKLGDRRFGLITLFHTLEHVPNPVEFLRRLSTYLEIGGRIAIEVPNVADALLTLYGLPAFAELYYQRAHLYYFSSDTLCRTIEAAGGKGLIEGIQRYDLSNHIRWMLTGEPGGQGYYRNVLTEVASAAYAEALVRSGHADTLWAIATF